MSVADVISRAEENMGAARERLFDLLRIPSVSTDPAFAADTRRAAQWMADQLSEIGFEATLHETPLHPMIVAHYPGPDGAGGGQADNLPHILYYGHYDVQPPDPVELWDTGPFEPTLVEAEHGPRIVCRGATDDKGQMMTFIEAFRAWFEVRGGLPAKVTVLLEGEEECGSPSLVPFLEAHKDILTADVCVISDTSSWNIDTPAVTTQLRGLLYAEVTLRGPSHDLHSGLFGGAVLNPINELARILGGLHDEQGRVQIPGFYDGILEPTNAQRASWEDLGFDEKAFLDGVGLKTPVGERGRSALERLWSRPTCDLNGIVGGYTGEGAKTVIADHAKAKLSCRLVPGQDPEKILTALEAFVRDRAPADAEIEIENHGVNRAIQVGTDSPWLKAAGAGIQQVFGKQPVMIGCGGSIPVAGFIQDVLGYDSLFLGFGLEDDRLHSPNEKFEVRCFENGIRSHVAVLDEMSRVRQAVA